METSNEFKIDEAEERRRAGIPAIVRAVLPRNFWENPLNWKRTKLAMGFAMMLITATGATAAVTVGKKATPTEGIQVASIAPTRDKSVLTKAKEVFTGEKCGDRKVEVEDPDTVPDHPKVSALLATTPCFNFGWFENGGKIAVINYVPASHGPGWNYSHDGASKDIEKASQYVEIVMGMKEIDGLLNGITLDMVRRVSGPETVEEMKKLTKKLDQEMEKSKPKSREDHTLKDDMFWSTLKKVARSEGLSVRLSDATIEREAADKIPGDFLLPDGTADRYKMILARMSPSDWEKFQMEYSLAGVPENEANPERLIVLEKRALSHLKDPRDIQAATERLKKYSPKTADRVLAELGLA